MKRAVLLAECAVIAFAQGAAWAEAPVAPDPAQHVGSGSTDTTPAANQAPTTSNGLQEIVVTAQRRAENLQRAAIAVTAVSGAALLEAGVTNATRLDTLVPGLTVTGSGSNNVYFLRGVGNFTTTPVSDPAVAVNYDGVYTGRASAGFSFFDLERVEVLKGPQGTLYGRNATGGAINILPVRPKLGELSGYGVASYGNYNALQLEGAINAPLGENGALRVSGSVINRDGYLKDGTGDDKSKALRVQMMSKLTPSLTVRLSGDYTHLGGAGVGTTYLGRYQFGPGGYTFIPSNLPASEGLFTPAAGQRLLWFQRRARL